MITTTTDPITAARAAALFVSDLSATGQPSGEEVAAAIQHALRTHGGSRGCAADVAAAYGDYPELAAPRMRWARGLVECVYPRRLPADGTARIGPRRTAGPDARAVYCSRGGSARPAAAASVPVPA